MKTQDIDYLKSVINALNDNIPFENEAQRSRLSDYASGALEILNTLQPSDFPECAMPVVMHWVAVEDELPNEHQDVMVYYYGNRNSKHFPDLQFMKQSSFYNSRFECDEEVTHWAELPEPPCA